MSNKPLFHPVAGQQLSGLSLTPTPPLNRSGIYGEKMPQIVKDMFGNEVDLEALAAQPILGRRKKRRDPIPSGHFGVKGTGPAGETCGSCKHLCRNQLAKGYLKCGLNRAKWTGGRKSDVRARDAACRHWEKSA